MNYEKAYQGALERAREIIKDYESRGLKDNLFYAKEDFEVIFPELKVWPANSATTANRQLYNRAILKLLSDYVEKYPDIRFGQMLYNLGVNPHFDEESREAYWNLSKTINKQK